MHLTSENDDAAADMEGLGDKWTCSRAFGRVNSEGAQLFKMLWQTRAREDDRKRSDTANTAQTHRQNAPDIDFAGRTRSEDGFVQC